MSAGINLGKVFFNFDVNTQEGEAKLKGVQNTLKSTGDNMTKMGSTLTKSLTLPLLGLATASVATFTSFEASMSKVKATMGASAEEMEKLSAKAREMGATTKFSASDAGEALNYMAMAGWKADQAIAGLPGVLNLATASGAGLAITSDIVTDTLTGMNMTAEETNRLVDVMAAASSNANTNVEMMGETFKYASPVAGALGIKIEELALATGLMANAGIKASMSGTSLRTGMTNLVKPSDQMAAAMEKYGIELVKNADGSSNLTETMKLMRKQLKNVEAQEKANVIATIMGKNAMSGWMAVINASEADFEKLETAINNSSGSAEAMAEIMNDNLQGKLLTLKSSFEEFLIVLGEKLVPLCSKVVLALTDATKWFGNLDDSTQKVIVATGLLVAAIGPLLTIGGKMATLFSLLTPTLAGTQAAVAGTTVATTGLMGVLAPLLPAILGITAVMGGLLFANEKYIDHLENNAINSVDYYVGKLEKISPKAAEAGNAIATLEANTTDIIADIILGQNLEERVPEVVALIQETVDKKNEILNKDAEKEIEYYNYMIEIGDEANKAIWEKKKKAAEEGIKVRSDGAAKEAEALKKHWDAVLKGEETYTQEDLNLILEANAEKINAEIENNAELKKAIENGDKNIEELRTRARADSISKLVASLVEERNKKLEAIELERQDRIQAIENDASLDAAAKENALLKTQEFYDNKILTTRDNSSLELAALQELYAEELNLYSIKNGEMLTAKQQNDEILMEMTRLNNEAEIAGLDLHYVRRGDTISSRTSAEQAAIEESNKKIAEDYQAQYLASGLSLGEFEKKVGSLLTKQQEAAIEIENKNSYIKNSYVEAFKKSGLTLKEFEARYGTLDSAIANNKDFALDANGNIKRSVSSTYTEAIAKLKELGFTYDLTTGNIVDGSGNIVASNVSAKDAVKKLTDGDKDLDTLGKAFTSSSKKAESANEKTGKSAEDASKKIDKTTESIKNLNKAPNPVKTITVNEVTNKTTNYKTTGKPEGKMLSKINDLNMFLRDKQEVAVGSWIGFSGSGENVENINDTSKLERNLSKSINVLSEKIDKFISMNSNKNVELKVNLDGHNIAKVIAPINDTIYGQKLAVDGRNLGL